ncbi:MAG: hypothetical protein WKF84_10290 [Pyrinomonadaceae bacterium]
MKLDYRIALINNQLRLKTLSENLVSVSAFGLDIETINWWNQQHEQVALIQLAYRVNNEVRVAVVDALSPLDLSVLRQPFELKTTTKVIHNAVFDAVRLARHLKICTAPIYDTMLAARRGGEKRYSLKAQVEKHLNVLLDKKAQQSDWSLRPLHPKQLDYAARDAVATLLLYEHQINRGLDGDYRLRAEIADDQGNLPLGDSSLPRIDQKIEDCTPVEQRPLERADLSDSSLALLGIITELPSRYGPEQLSVSVGEERVGLAGWIIDRVLGENAELDESSAKIKIAELCQSGLVRITLTRRLEANESGKDIWRKRKPVYMSSETS